MRLRLEYCTVLDVELRLPEFIPFPPSNSDYQSATHTFLNFELRLDFYIFLNFDSDSHSLYLSQLRTPTPRVYTFLNVELRLGVYTCLNFDSDSLNLYLLNFELRLPDFMLFPTSNSYPQTLYFSQLRTLTRILHFSQIRTPTPRFYTFLNFELRLRVAHKIRRARVRACVRACARARAFVRACVLACVRACVRACVSTSNSDSKIAPFSTSSPDSRSSCFSRLRTPTPRV